MLENSGNTMRASVIIPTYNGGYKISNLLDSLMNQTVKDFEVIIVIDGSADNTLKVLQPYNKIFNTLIIVQQKNLGRSTSRNNGVKKSSSEILIFYDDDMKPNPQSVEKHLAFHKEFDGLLAGNQIEAKEKSSTDIQNYKATLSKKWIEKYHEGRNKLTIENLFFTTANCSMRKEHFLKLKGFDERLTDAEDFDFALRATQRDIQVYFDKSNEAIHHDLITCTGYIKRLREYELAKREVQRIHQDVRLFDSPSLPYWKKAFYFPFAISIFPMIVDRFNLLLILPRSIRYKFYDVMIHSLSHVYTYKHL